MRCKLNNISSQLITIMEINKREQDNNIKQIKKLKSLICELKTSLNDEHTKYILSCDKNVRQAACLVAKDIINKKLQRELEQKNKAFGEIKLTLKNRNDCHIKMKHEMMSRIQTLKNDINIVNNKYDTSQQTVTTIYKEELRLCNLKYQDICTNNEILHSSMKYMLFNFAKIY